MTPIATTHRTGECMWARRDNMPSERNQLASRFAYAGKTFRRSRLNNHDSALRGLPGLAYQDCGRRRIELAQRIRHDDQILWWQFRQLLQINVGPHGFFDLAVLRILSQSFPQAD